MQLCAFLCELSRKFCVWLLLLGSWSPHPHDFETSNFHIPELFSSPPPEMHSRRAPAEFVRHDERITLICSLLHLINFEASYALEKLKFRRNSQLFLARCLAMLALSLFARSAKTSLDSTYAPHKQSWRSWQCATSGRREDRGSTPPRRNSFLH